MDCSNPVIYILHESKGKMKWKFWSKRHHCEVQLSAVWAPGKLHSSCYHRGWCRFFQQLLSKWTKGCRRQRWSSHFANFIIEYLLSWDCTQCCLLTNKELIVKQINRSGETLWRLAFFGELGGFGPPPARCHVIADDGCCLVWSSRRERGGERRMAEYQDQPWDWWYYCKQDPNLPLSILQLDPADRAVLRIAGILE